MPRPDVTLEQDLSRRDLTMNAIARDDQGRLIDPHHGTDDIKAGVLRHVGPAFAEDPVRILRVARFAARFGFRIAPETMKLMREMARSGEADALVPERVWQELARGLMESRPSLMFEVLRESGALARVMPEVDALWDDPDVAREAMRALDAAATVGQTSRHALPCWRAGWTRWRSNRLRIVSSCRRIAATWQCSRHAMPIPCWTPRNWTRPPSLNFSARRTRGAGRSVSRPDDGGLRRRARRRSRPGAARARARGVRRGQRRGNRQILQVPSDIRGNVDAARFEAIRRALARDK